MAGGRWQFTLTGAIPDTEAVFPCITELCEGARQGSVVQADIELPGSPGVRPVLAVALRVDKEIRGFVLDELTRPDPRQRADAAEFAHALARLAGLTLGNVERRDMERRVERLHADLEQAREVQRQILPPAHGQYAGTRYAFHIPCRDEHPLLEVLKQRAGVRLYGINHRDAAENAVGFLGELGNPYDRIGADSDNPVSIHWGVYGVPETFVVNARGVITYKHVGPITPQSLEKEVLPAVDKAKAG